MFCLRWGCVRLHTQGTHGYCMSAAGQSRWYPSLMMSYSCSTNNKHIKPSRTRFTSWVQKKKMKAPRNQILLKEGRKKSKQITFLFLKRGVVVAVTRIGEYTTSASSHCVLSEQQLLYPISSFPHWSFILFIEQCRFGSAKANWINMLILQKHLRLGGDKWKIKSAFCVV